MPRMERKMSTVLKLTLTASLLYSKMALLTLQAKLKQVWSEVDNNN